MAILGLEDKIVITRPNYTLGNSNESNGNLSHTSNYNPDSYSHTINFGSTGNNATTTQTITTQTDNMLGNLGSITRTYSFQPLYNVVTEHQIPDASISDNEDIVMIIPRECTYGTDYQIIRRAEMVGQPLELEEGFYYAHADELDGIEKALQSMQNIKTEMIKYEINGSLDRLIEFARENGLNTTALRQPDYYGASSNEHIIAYTIPHKYVPGEFFLLGAGKSFYDISYKTGNVLNLHYEYELEDTLTEELLHQAQPSWLFEQRDVSGRVYMELVEGHVKALKSKYFFELAEEATDQDTHNSYRVLSNFNYGWYKALVYQHVKLYGIDIDKNTLEKMLDTKSPDELAEILSEGATRVPDRCAEGGYGYGKNKNNVGKGNNDDNNNTTKYNNALLIVKRLEDYFDDGEDQDNINRYDSSPCDDYNCGYGCSDAEGGNGSDKSDGEDSSGADGEGSDSSGDGE